MPVRPRCAIRASRRGSITPSARRWLTDFRFGFFRYRVFVNPNGVGTSPAKDAGIPGLNNDAYYTSGMPAFSLNGTGGFNFGYSLGINPCNCPLNEQENEFQWVGNTTHIVGNHSIKFGVDWRFQQNLRVPSDSHRSGQLTFDPTTTQGPTGGGLGLRIVPARRCEPSPATSATPPKPPSGRTGCSRMSRTRGRSLRSSP